MLVACHLVLASPQASNCASCRIYAERQRLNLDLLAAMLPAVLSPPPSGELPDTLQAKVRPPSQAPARHLQPKMRYNALRPCRYESAENALCGIETRVMCIFNNRVHAIIDLFRYPNDLFRYPIDHFRYPIARDRWATRSVCWDSWRH